MCARFFFQQAIDYPHLRKYLSQSLRCVQIIIQRGFKGLRQVRPLLEQLCGQRRFIPRAPGKRFFGFQQGSIDPLLGLFGLIHPLGRKIYGAAVMLSQKEKTQGFGQITLQNVANGFKIAQRLGHLFRIDLHKTVMHPIAGQFTMTNSLGLGNFVFMMGKDQILTAAVNIQGQIRCAHGRAFDMPTRSPLAPGAVPGRFAGFGSLPERKIQRIFLFLARSHARA